MNIWPDFFLLFFFLSQLHFAYEKLFQQYHEKIYIFLFVEHYNALLPQTLM